MHIYVYVYIYTNEHIYTYTHIFNNYRYIFLRTCKMLLTSFWGNKCWITLMDPYFLMKASYSIKFFFFFFFKEKLVGFSPQASHKDRIFNLERTLAHLITNWHRLTKVWSLKIISSYVWSDWSNSFLIYLKLSWYLIKEKLWVCHCH